MAPPRPVPWPGLPSVAMAAAMVAASCSPPVTPEGEIWFDERAAATGLDFVHSTGADGSYWFPEIVGSGVCLFDFDRDAFLDIYLVQSGSISGAGAGGAGDDGRNRLFRSERGRAYVDVTDAGGVGDPGYGMGCAVADYDGDGWIDLYVTNLGPNRLYRNLGDGTFAEVGEETGTDFDDWSTSAGFGDFDGDGRLDLFVVNYLDWAPHREIECHAGARRDYCSPNNYSAPQRARLARNLGDGTFEEVSEAWGLGGAFGNGLGLRLADFDLDGDLDAYVANDGMANQLWINDGTGALEDRALLLGAALNAEGMAEAGMGIAAADIDGDGDEDLLVAHLNEETNTLYLNSGGAFDDRTASLGLGASSLGRTGFGTGFADFDNDGELDLFVANGKVRLGGEPPPGDDPYAEPDLLLRGLAQGGFQEVPGAGVGGGLVRTSRGAAFGDLDNDGAVDVVVSNRDGAPYLLHNLVGARGAWVLLEILEGGVEAVGARVRVDAGGRLWWRTVATTASYCSADDSRVHVGLGEAERVDRVVVVWPDGEEEAFGPFEARRIHRLERGAPEAPERSAAEE